MTTAPTDATVLCGHHDSQLLPRFAMCDRRVGFSVFAHVMMIVGEGGRRRRGDQTYFVTDPDQKWPSLMDAEPLPHHVHVVSILGPAVSFSFSVGHNEATGNSSHKS